MFEAQGLPMRLVELPRPKPAAGEILLEVRACGVCRTDLHVLDGDRRQPKLPLILRAGTVRGAAVLMIG